MKVVKKIEENFPKKKIGSAFEKGIERFYSNVIDGLLESFELKLLKAIIIASPGQFRDELYKLTTGEERTIPDSLYNYIDKRIPHQNPLHDLRGGLGVDLFDQKVLENGLDELIKNGYPIRDRNQNISLHKRILKHIFVLLHLPDKREDIRKLERF